MGCPSCSESDSWPKPVGGPTKSTAPSRSRTASACSSVRSSAWIEAPPRFYGSGPRQWRPDAPARNVNARHAALGELVAAWIARQLGWIVAAEVSFAINGERGIIDRLAWHESSSSLVVVELKTAIVDVDELIGTLDRKRRLAARIAVARDWAARSVSAWLIVGDSSTNRRRVADHRTLLTAALPRDGRSLAPLFLHPERGPESGIAF